MKHLNLLLLILITSVHLSKGQSIKGIVKNEQNNPIPFAVVGLEGTPYGSTTDEKGYFEISGIKPGKYVLIVNFLGYEKYKKPINIDGKKEIFLSIQLKQMAMMFDEVTISGSLSPISMKNATIPIEVVKPRLFEKSGNTNLFEGINMVNGVRSQVNCNVCGTGDIHINGMEGPYTIVLLDGMPMVGGLSTVYGLMGIPNSMIQQTEIIKGSNSVLYGSSAIAGIVNVITKDAETAPKVNIGYQVSNWLENNLDLGFSFNTKKIGILTGGNLFFYDNPKDLNGDNFTDIPVQNRQSIFTKINVKRKSKKNFSVFGRYFNESRWGGEMQWTKEFAGTDSIYGETISTRRYEVLSSYEFNTKIPISWNGGFSYHKQNSFYGTTKFDAVQQLLFNRLYMHKKFSNIHQLLVGISFLYENYDDNTPATQTSQDSIIQNQPSITYLPGIFLKNEYKHSEKLQSTIGLRYDYNSVHGNIFTPQIGFKYDLSEYSSLRLVSGTGYRIVHVFTEDHAALTGSRDVIFTENLKPEKSYNSTLHYNKFINTKWGFMNLKSSLFYYYFTNRILPDYETNDNAIIYSNLNGFSVNRGMSIDLTANFEIPLIINMGITLIDSYYRDKMPDNSFSEKKRPMLTENFSSTTTATYTLKKFSFDYSSTLYSPMKLPVLENDYRPEYSPWFSIHNFKITYKTPKKHLTFYTGVNNIFDFKPRKDAIMRAFDPFDKQVNVNNPYGYTFDPGYVYTSNQGRYFYFGIKYNLERKKN
ncbi:MAG TPA: TonB-dependent receptor [Flavobacteriales bacterium]|nr:TonB-dependent receptor [Flavobacteriales bacterium]